MSEKWKPINGYDGQYLVSDCGNVKSLKAWNDGQQERLLKQGTNRKGYKVVSLSKNSKVKHFTVHRLVALAFIPNPHNFNQVNHKNEDKTDNRVCNLEWCNNFYNMNYGTRLARQIAKRSKPVICVETGVVYPSSKEASRRNPPIRQGNITLCCQHKNKSAGGYHWEYYSS